jgi:hypothetical protein
MQVLLSKVNQGTIIDHITDLPFINALAQYIHRLNMETSAAVSEVLDIDNYFVWSVQVRTYLIAQDLWNIVKATEEPCKQENDEAASKAWTKKNAMALHVIQISCEPRICFAIGLITSAKIAWETLEEICSLPESICSGISLSKMHLQPI